MRLLIKLTIVLLLLGGLAAAAYQPALEYWAERNRPQFRTSKTEQGEIIETINSTGSIEPVLSVHVGSFVSGPIEALHVDFNDEVNEGDLLAEIDPRIYKASVERDRAALATRQADLQRIRARLQNASNDEQRALGLKSDNPEYISDTELDQYKFARIGLEAEVLLAQASIDQAKANLENSLANLEYTRITSPVSGIVIDKKIEPGQTLASQFQTPELFIIAPDMREEMHIFASVDEADIGEIRKAKEAGQIVQFTVDAYRGELFEGQIWQIRLSPTTNQNVVTYPVVISASNASLKLLPGMTADISFQIEQKSDVLKVPNAALRFYPAREHVRAEDHAIIDGTANSNDADDRDVAPASQKASADENRKKRHVWVKDGHLLKAIPIVTGISDYKFSEVVSGELKPDQELVVGLETK
ncbi:efflux RND transporter periplasmic adaptor subunit [Rubinisphaera margarita]|uniref:efflux RND transporter periplasmic adaptor subunit n=1 Tax=Rubinisphaera margarita TaxID=2909586 RepID=UPI001EE8F092|nr:efflux RND transporter periplasmic adaptor subunit [Rubinisphaera margarita]MCG6156334.1 efflux RND transporter periplasmic adaptor subunit [Rubinisphaera margarita]